MHNLNLDCVDVVSIQLGLRIFAVTSSHLASFACKFLTQDVCWVQKPLWWADLQVHSVTADLVQNKMCFSAPSNIFPGLPYTLWPVFEKGEVSFLSVLVGVGHCCRCKLESQQHFVASGASVLRCHHENRPPTLCRGSTSCLFAKIVTSAVCFELCQWTLLCLCSHQLPWFP